MANSLLMIRLNGEEKHVTRGDSVAALVAQLGIDVRKVAIERNGEILPRSRYETTLLAEGDALELVTFIGGG